MRNCRKSLLCLSLRHPHAVSQTRGGEQDHLLALCETIENLRLGTVVTPKLYRSKSCGPILDAENGPITPATKESAGRDDHGVIVLPDHDAGFDPIAVAKTGMRFGRVGESDHRRHALLFDTKCRELGDAEWIDSHNLPREGFEPAPIIDDGAVARGDLNGVGGQKLDHHL